MTRVLVVGDDVRSFLAVVRSLGRRGMEVHAAPFDRASAALRSRYLKGVWDVVPPSVSKERFVARIAEAADAFDWIVPVDDRSIVPLLDSPLAGLPRHRIALPDPAAHALAHSKLRTRETALAAGVPVAPGALCQSPDDARAWVAGHGRWPVVLKPLSSFTGSRLAAKRMVRKAYSPDDLERLLREEFDEGEFLIEANALGEGVGHGTMCHEGQVLALFQHRRLHEPLHGGGSSYRVSETPSPDLRAATEALARATNWTGVMMVEYLDGPEGPVLVEINGRFYGSLPLAVAAGCDLPAWLHDLLREGRREFPHTYRVGLRSRNLMPDLQWLKANLRADRSDPTLHTRPLAEVLREPLGFLTGRERVDSWAKDDPAPFRAEVARFRRTLLRKARRGRSGRPGFGDARRVLFVCKGNICRSPFAERLAASLDPTREYRSAGTYPREGRLSPDPAPAVAREFGVSLDDHRSRFLTPEDEAWADLVVGFDDENLDALTDGWSSPAKSRLLLPTAEIVDPYGGDEERFRAVYRVIESAIVASVSDR